MVKAVRVLTRHGCVPGLKGLSVTVSLARDDEVSLQFRVNKGLFTSPDSYDGQDTETSLSQVVVHIEKLP